MTQIIMINADKYLSYLIIKNQRHQRSNFQVANGNKRI